MCFSPQAELNQAPSGQQAAQQSKGVNPVTRKPGINPKESGKTGELRPGRGGRGRFGDKRSNPLGYHTGADIAGDAGDPIYANRDGTVTNVSGKATDKKGYGLMITITHYDNSKTRYAHLSGSNVSKDDPVTEGQRIGSLGTRGNAIIFRGGAEEHVHFEYLPAGCAAAACATDPVKFSNSRP